MGRSKCSKNPDASRNASGTGNALTHSSSFVRVGNIGISKTLLHHGLLAYSRVGQTFNGTVTLRNISTGTINGPLQLVFFGMPPGVTLTNATASLFGTPYLTVPAVASLAPGQSVTVGIQFKNPSNATINLAPVVYSGSIN